MNNREHIMNPWVNASVLKIKKWTDNLFSLFLKAPILPFQAGQFTRIALPNNTSDDYTTRTMIQRAYSYVNAPSEKILEIYIARVIHGKLSNRLYNLAPGDTILIKKKSMGFFTIKEIPHAQILWMLATGTAIGPYCSILQEDSNDLNKFEHIILVHAVRYQNELTYFPLMQKLKKKYNGKLKIQSIVSREKHENSLTGRIPLLLKERILEKTIGFSITPNNSHVMLCGNPEMVKDACIVLKNRNMNKHLRRKSGHITIENYW